MGNDWYKVVFESKTIITSKRIAEELADGERIYHIGTLTPSELQKLRSRGDVEILEEKKGGKKK